MARQLLVSRHAKSSASAATISDAERHDAPERSDWPGVKMAAVRRLPDVFQVQATGRTGSVESSELRDTFLNKKKEGPSFKESVPELFSRPAPSLSALPRPRFAALQRPEPLLQPFRRVAATWIDPDVLPSLPNAGPLVNALIPALRELQCLLSCFPRQFLQHPLGGLFVGKHLRCRLK